MTIRLVNPADLSPEDTLYTSLMNFHEAIMVAEGSTGNQQHRQDSQAPCFIVGDIPDTVKYDDEDVGYIFVVLDDQPTMLAIFHKSENIDPLRLVSKLHTFFYKDKEVVLEERVDMSYFEHKSKTMATKETYAKDKQ